MSELIITKKSNIDAIADAIRNKTGITEELSLEGIATEIENTSDIEDKIISRALSSYTNDRVGIVGSYAFYNHYYLTDVNFPNCILISANAFESCSKLTSINFPICTSIAYNAFQSCTNLSAANFPACKSINFNAFNYCWRLSNISFPACEYIDDAAFGKCTNLTNISFPNCRTVDTNAFISCSKLTDANFPVCETIGYNAFQFCSSLTNISFPACISISTEAFQFCRNLTDISFPNCRTIAGNVFESCANLTNVSFPICRLIGSSAFKYCTNLSAANFPACVSVNRCAFMYCSNLSKVSLPVCTSIDREAFYGCTELNTIHLTGSSLCYLYGSTIVFGNTKITSTTGSIFVNASLLESYKKATNWTYYSNIILPNSPFTLKDIKNTKVLFNITKNMSVELLLFDEYIPTVSVISSDESIATVSNIQVTKQNITFDILSNEVEGNTDITITAISSNPDKEYTETKTFTLTVLETMPPEPTYEVDTSVSDFYTFALNSNDYYESTNKGINNSCALCKLNINAPLDCTMYLDCINYGENTYDYGILSKLDSILGNNSDPDNIYYKSFKDSSSSNIVTVTYDIPAGEHFIYIKYIKDGSQHSNNDSLQFKVRFE